jgi:hypothetical protein
VKVTVPAAAAAQAAGREILGTLASPLTSIRHPRYSQRVKDQSITKRELVRIEHGSIGILDDRIAGNAPVLVADDPATMFTRRLGIVLVAVIPTLCGIGEHSAPPVLSFNKFPVASAGQFGGTSSD